MYRETAVALWARFVSEVVHDDKAWAASRARKAKKPLPLTLRSIDPRE